jgi:hypothetical protein
VGGKRLRRKGIRKLYEGTRNRVNGGERANFTGFNRFLLKAWGQGTEE